MKSILNREFRYVNSAVSSKPNYLKNKFDRIRRELVARAEAEKAEAEAVTIEQAVKVRVMRS